MIDLIAYYDVQYFAKLTFNNYNLIIELNNYKFLIKTASVLP